MPNVVLFAFYGRRANIDLQMPFIKRILIEHPNVTFDAWNLCRRPEDNAHVRTLANAAVTVHNEFYNAPDAWNNVYRHYANPKYRDCLFVKLDDDIVFLETERFEEFVNTIDENRGSVVSARVINNGACTPITPGISDIWTGLGIPLLDVHTSHDYATMCHRWFFANWTGVIDGGLGEGPVPTREWLSINAIGYDWETNCKVAESVGSLSPAHIAGRDWPPGTALGDEGAFNMLPRIILRGFTAAHLTFGPQYCTDEQQTQWRAEYAKIAQEYLS